MADIEENIGKYKVEAKLGEGGMGVVYRAWDPVLERRVAIKLMLLASDDMQDELRSRFFREARSAARLHHPNIVSVYELGEDRSRPYIAMEYVEGRDLNQIIRKREFVPFERKLEWVIQVCKGLHFAHTHGVVHRDIKPHNIRITEEGEPKIMDFGLARLGSSELTQTGRIMGTPHYMSPEQVRGTKALDGRSDLFSVGVILYQLLSGKRPFDSENLTTVMFQIVSEKHTPVDELVHGCPGQLGRIVDRCLAKEPGERFASCEELARALVVFQGELGKEASDLRAKVQALSAEVTAAVARQGGAPGPDDAAEMATRQSLPSSPAVTGDPNDYGNLLLRFGRLREQLRQLEEPGAEAAVAETLALDVAAIARGGAGRPAPGSGPGSGPSVPAPAPPPETEDARADRTTTLPSPKSLPARPAVAPAAASAAAPAGPARSSPLLSSPTVASPTGVSAPTVASPAGVSAPTVASPAGLSAPTAATPSRVSAPTSVSTPASPTSIVESRRPTRAGLWIAAAAVLLVLLAAGGYFALDRRGKPQPEVPPVAPAAPGTLVLDVSPWAEVKSITRADTGEAVRLQPGATPYVIDLPAGSYRIAVSNPVLGSSATIDARVTAGAVARVHQALPDFRADQEVSALLGEGGR